MNYEQKYKEALERAMKLAIDGYLDAIAINDIFPELKESEDERVRKAIIAYIDHGQHNGISNKDMVAWLEKQGEQTQLDYEHADIPQKDFAPIEYKTPNTDKVIEWLDCTLNADKVIEWLRVNSTLFGAKWCKIENIIEQFKKDFGL